MSVGKKYKVNKLSRWLTSSLTKSPDMRYRHRMLMEDKNQRVFILDELKTIVHKAHEDARQHLRDVAGTSLDPLSFYSSTTSSDIISNSPLPTNFDPSKGYPESCHLHTLKGYFGEIFAGIIAENYDPFEEQDWEVPAFLFRFHLTEFQQLELLRETERQCKIQPGRTGDDCLAFRRAKDGRIIQLIVCEAKCTKSHNVNMITDAHKKLSETNTKPVDLLRLIEILREYDDPESQGWVEALRQLYIGPTDASYERCDLLSYVCGQRPIRKTTWLSVDVPHNLYSGDRRLEVVEVHLCDVEDLIKEIYGKHGECCDDS
jgi:hypothetical protein